MFYMVEKIMYLIQIFKNNLLKNIVLGSRFGAVTNG